MKWVVAALIASCLFGASDVSGQEQSGPFGLRWGQSAEAIRATGAELQPLPGADYGVVYTASKLEKVLSDQETTLLTFGHNDALWRVVAVSRTFNNDPYGAGARSRYNDLVE